MYIDFGFIINLLELIVTISVAISLILLVRQKKQDFNFKRREYSANFIKDWNHPDLIKNQRSIHNKIGLNSNQLNEHEISELLKKHHGLYYEITKILNFFEEMAQSIEYGLSDEEYLRKYFLVTSVSNFRIFKVFIELQRTRLYTSQPFLSFEKLVYKWERQYKNEELLPILKREL